MTTLFDELVLGGPTAVRQLLGRSETLELDFKQRTPAGRSGDDRKVLGKALSAFANSMGGLIVWGVDCRKNSDGVDEVIGFAPIEGLAKFASDMRDWTVEAVMPRLTDVRVHPLDEGQDRGFLLIAVDRSERRPHHCEFGEKGYFRRAGASSRRMEHFEIEDAFRRFSSPDLQLEYRVENGGSSYSSLKADSNFAVLVSLRNVSNVSARNAYVSTFQTGFQPHGSLLLTTGITVREQPPPSIL